MTIERALYRYGGVARIRDLHTLGVSRDAVEKAVRGGIVVKLRNGVIAQTNIGDVIEAAWHGGSLTCASALRNHGIWTLEPDERVHVHVRSGLREYEHPGCHCITHHTNERFPLGIVPVREALRQAALCLPAEAFFAALESALNLRKLSEAGRAWLKRRLPKRLRWLIDFARVDAQSGLESLLRLRAHALGLKLQSQVLIPHVGRVDFLIDNIIIEVDGHLGHADPASRHKDLVRDAHAARQGYRVLRFDYRLVVHDWPTVAATILAATAGA